jgi:hypothetical protein
MTDNADLIDKCVETKDRSTCVDKCQWRRGKEVKDNKDLILGGDLFGSNFCHPPTTDDWDNQASKCITLKTQDDCRKAQCLWSTGKSLVPDHDFCAVARITQDAKSYSACAERKTDCAKDP